MLIARILTVNGVVYASYSDGKYYLIRGDIFSNYFFTDEEVDMLRILPPVLPSKIIGIGGNYLLHRHEFNMDLNKVPVIFFKPPSSIIPTNAPILIPESAINVEFEAELAIIISSVCKNVKSQQADKYILGYTCANDVTERSLQSIDGQWGRAKGFDTFCPIGPYISMDITPDKLYVKTFVNGHIKQSGNTRDMIFSPSKIVEYVSGIMTLLPGDVILTGTPNGVGPIVSGDIVEVEIEKIGKLINRVF